MTDPSAPAPLSAAGLARKERMRTELTSAMTRRASCRRTARAAASAGAFALAIAAAWAGVVLHRAPPASPGRSLVDATPAPSVDTGAPALRNVQIVSFTRTTPSARVIETNHARAASLVARSDTRSPTQILDDDQLFDALGTTGNTYGLIRSGDHVSVTCYSCPAPPPQPPEPSRPPGGSI